MYFIHTPSKKFYCRPTTCSELIDTFIFFKAFIYAFKHLFMHLKIYSFIYF